MRNTRVFGKSSEVASVGRIAASAREFEKLPSRIRRNSSHYNLTFFNDKAKSGEYKGDVDRRADVVSDSIKIAKSIFQKFYPLKNDSELVLFILKTVYTQ